MTNPYPCLHKFVSRSLLGVVCRDCGARFTEGLPAHGALIGALEQRLEALDRRVENSEKALAVLGLRACDRCGGWHKPGRELFAAHNDGGDLAVCRPCVSACLSDEDDELLYDAMLDAFPPTLVAELVRWALRLPAKNPVRCHVMRTFPNEGHREAGRF